MDLPHSAPSSPIAGATVKTPSSRKFRPAIIVAGTLFLLLVCSVFLVRGHPPVGPTIPLSEFIEKLKLGEVESVVVEGDILTGELAKPISSPTSPVITKFQTNLPNDMGNQWAFINYLLEKNNGTKVAAAPAETDSLLTVIAPLLPWMLIFGIVWFLSSRSTNLRSPVEVIIRNLEDA